MAALPAWPPFRWGVEAFRRMRRRAQLRRDLEILDDRMIRDIGVRRADLEVEALKPFWRR